MLWLYHCLPRFQGGLNYGCPLLFSENSVISFTNPEQINDPLTDLLRSGAKRLIHQYVEAELMDLLEKHRPQLTEDNKPAVVRNGYHPEREIQTGIGPVERSLVKAKITWHEQRKTGDRRWCPGFLVSTG